MKGTEKDKWNIPRIVVTAVITVVVVIALRIFVFASFRIPSFSMEPSLLSGDFILVNKLIPGPRIDFLRKNKDGQAVRLKGYHAIKRNDVLVFNEINRESGMMDIDWNTYYVKRCKGIPGDSLIIKNGLYYLKINGRTQAVTSTVSSTAVPLETIPRYDRSPMFHPLGWTVSSLGPLYIPRKGDEVVMDETNLLLYKKLIEYETGKKLIKKEEGVYLDNEVIDCYRFNRNYYFIAGDNRLDSRDSRYWGLLPEDHIVGKVSYIWKSKDSGTNAYRFDRFFKIVE